MALYPGVLDAAHEAGLKSITTTLIQVPSELNGNTAVVHATVETAKGTFTGIGDASPANVSRAMANGLIRFAETRAKARAMRDAINIGEALADDPDDDEPRHVNHDTGEITRAMSAAHDPASYAPTKRSVRSFYEQLAAEARLAGITTLEPLADGATDDEIIAAGKRLRARVDAAHGLPTPTGS